MNDEIRKKIERLVDIILYIYADDDDVEGLSVVDDAEAIREWLTRH